jgi:hypothetical protein
MRKNETQSRYREDHRETPDWLLKKKCPHKDKYLAGQRIMPRGITGREKVADLVDHALLAYNGARLKEGCQLFAEKMLERDVTVGLSVSGALTLPRHALRAEPAGARGAAYL